jgi:hypothetical protein
VRSICGRLFLTVTDLDEQHADSTPDFPPKLMLASSPGRRDTVRKPLLAYVQDELAASD